MLDSLDRALGWVERALYLGAALALAAMMVSISADALGRYLFDRPIRGVYEVNEMYLLTATVYLSIARAQRLDEHIAVDSIYRTMPAWARRLSRGIGRALAAALFAAVAYKTGEMAHSQFVMGNMTSGVVQLPSWIGWFLVFTGSGAMTLRLLLQVVLEIGGRLPAGADRHG